MVRIYIVAALTAGQTLIALPMANAQFLQQAKLFGTGAVGTAYQGISVAVSGDGNTAIVGGYGDNAARGAAWVYVRTDSGWVQQGNKLVGSGAVGTGVQQGYSVSISADGNTAVLGAPGDSAQSGAAWVFTRDTSGVWSQQGQKLFGSGAVGKARQGISCALSASGDTAIIGGYVDNAGAGAAWVFARDTSGLWSQQGQKLFGSGAVGSAQQGISVAMSGDGNAAIVGGWWDDALGGAAWVFEKVGAAWVQQGTKLSGTGAVGNAYQGNSVSLSGDGNTALVAGYGDDASAGAVWVFARTGASWSQQGSKLVGAGAVGPGRQGQAVSLSSDGNAFVSSAVYDNAMAGAAWVFARTGTLWSQLGSKLVDTGSVGSAQMGQSATISGDASTIVLGGFQDNAGAGAAWVFARSTNTFVSPASTQLPAGFRLEQNYPNPFNPTTKIRFQVSTSGHVTLKVYDVIGRKVATLLDNNLKAGGYEATFSSENLSSGVYFYQLRTGTFSVTRKMMLTK